MTDAVVIGGGPAGAALATRLARAGRKVVLVEREAGPTDKVCGEFLSREAGLYLASLGLDLPALGAVPIDAVRLCAGGHVAAVPLPFAATSLSRRVLDEALLRRAASAGAMIRRGVKVSDLSPSSCIGAWHLDRRPSSKDTSSSCCSRAAMPVSSLSRRAAPTSACLYVADAFSRSGNAGTTCSRRCARNRPTSTLGWRARNRVARDLLPSRQSRMAT